MQEMMKNLAALQRESNVRLQAELEKPVEERNMRQFCDHLWSSDDKPFDPKTYRDNLPRFTPRTSRWLDAGQDSVGERR